MKFKGLKTLVAMQLKDKIDLSFLKSVRSAIFKSIFTVLGFLVVTAAFFLAFKLGIMFSVFSFTPYLPDTVLTLLFSIIQIMAIISCTVSLTKALYMASDNKVLFTFPVETNTVFFSKLILYFLFELKRNLTITLPVFIAYGLNNGAVFYYYIWAILCFVIISAIPVVIGAVLSIPALFVSRILSKSKILKAVIVLACFATVTLAVFSLVNLIPENINILGQWGSITAAISRFLDNFCKTMFMFHAVVKMVIGGTIQISTRLFNVDTFIYLGLILVIILCMLGIAYLLARPLFFKMASGQFEFEKSSSAKGSNKIHRPSTSPFFETVLMTIRSSADLISLAVQLILPSLAVFLLNKIYGAMNTSFSGQTMTRSFTIVVMLAMLLSFNSDCAAVYSKEGSARNILKTRPTTPIKTVLARLFPRFLVGGISLVLATVFYGLTAEVAFIDCVIICLMSAFANFSHLFWSAEMDVMNPQSEQYATVGETYSNPNEVKSTVLAFAIAVFCGAVSFFLSDRGTQVGIIKTAAIMGVFFAIRLYLYVTRVNLYFEEK